MTLIHTRKNLLSIALMCVALLCVVPQISYAAKDDTDEQLQEREEELQKQLEAKMKEIAALSVFAQSKGEERASLEREVALLEADIKKAQLEIEARNIKIKQLGGEINVRKSTIQALSDKYERQKASLAHLLQATQKLDDRTVIELALSRDNISDFFLDLDSFETVSNGLQASFREIEGTKADTETEKQSLQTAQTKEIDHRYAQELEKEKIEAKEDERQYVLGVTKGQEALYNQLIAERRAEAARISAELFSLRDSDGVQFGEALVYAKEAERVTGVRAAFLLGILKQESNIGQNVGSCVITNLETGETRSINSGNTFLNGIHPVRDLPVFQTLMKKLGREPLETKVSCPLSTGYGGAMGPAQFIPSTWNAYISRLEASLGEYPDPWNPRHAFIASATYLADLGAGIGGYSAEHEAAARYYAGGNWKTLGQGYASSVLAHAQTIQTTMIDPIERAEED